MCLSSRSSLYVRFAWMMDWNGLESFFTATFKPVFTSYAELKGQYGTLYETTGGNGFATSKPLIKQKSWLVSFLLNPKPVNNAIHSKLLVSLCNDLS